jgi:Ni/Co efflux regulator RcnB
MMKRLLLGALAALVVAGPLSAAASAQEWGREARYHDRERYNGDRDDRRSYRRDRDDNWGYGYRRRHRNGSWQNNRNGDWGRDRDRDHDRYRERYGY